MLDTRYHIIYLCAVFLMLGFGIIIGESLLGPVQVKQQKTALKQLDARVSETLADDKATHDVLSKTDAAWDAIRPRLVDGKLLNRRIALVQTSDIPDSLNDARDSVTTAGGTTVDVIIGPNLQAYTPDENQTVMDEITAADPSASVNPTASDAHTEIVQSLARILTQGTSVHSANAEVLRIMQHHDIVTVDGDLSLPCDTVVLCGGSSVSPDRLVSAPGAADSEIIDAVRESTPKHETIVGCETLTSASSFIPSYQESGVATVDCVDMALGKVDLVFACLGGTEKADYGMKSTATRQLPETLQNMGAAL